MTTGTKYITHVDDEYVKYILVLEAVYCLMRLDTELPPVGKAQVMVGLFV